MYLLPKGLSNVLKSFVYLNQDLSNAVKTFFIVKTWGLGNCSKTSLSSHFLS